MEYFLAYHSYLEAMEPLSDAERGRLFTALLEYSITGIVPELRGGERYTFATLKGNIDRDVAKYNAKCAKNKESAGKRWDANGCERIRTDANGCQDKDKEEDKDNTASAVDARAQAPPNIADFGLSPDLEAAINDWLAYKRERREAYKPTGLKSLLTQIKKAAAEHGDAAVVEVIRQSMSANYMGIVFDRLKQQKPLPPRRNNVITHEQLDKLKPSAADIERMKKLYDRLNGG